MRGARPAMRQSLRRLADGSRGYQRHMRRGIALIVALLAVVPGCGQDERRTVPVGDLVAALKQTRAAPTQHVRIDIAVQAPGLGDQHLSGTGRFDNRAKRGRMSLDMSEFAALAGPELGPDARDAEQIIIGFTVYMRWSPFAKQLGTGKEWIKFDLQELGEEQGLDLGAFTGPQGDPTQQLDQLRAAEDGVEVMGDDTVRGEAATHYKATVDLRRYAEQVSGGQRERVRRTVDRLVE